MNKILAIGAAGPFAGLVLPELSKRNADVRAFVRKPEEAPLVRRNGASEVAIGDLTDADMQTPGTASWKAAFSLNHGQTKLATAALTTAMLRKWRPLP